MSKISHKQFKLSNPNNGLSFAGIGLLLLFIYSSYRESMGLVLGVGVLVKILVLVWIPKAARLVGRNGVGWTIFAFITPSVALIILGVIGYKPSPEKDELFTKCSKALHEKKVELDNRLKNEKITQVQYEQEYETYYAELQDYAKDYLNSIYDNENTEFLNEQLKKKGYVFDANSEVFVEFEDKCPACGTNIEIDTKECPGCGLNLD